MHNHPEHLDILMHHNAEIEKWDIETYPLTNHGLLGLLQKKRSDPEKQY